MKNVDFRAGQKFGQQGKKTKGKTEKKEEMQALEERRRKAQEKCTLGKPCYFVIQSHQCVRYIRDVAHIWS